MDEFSINSTHRNFRIVPVHLDPNAAAMEALADGSDGARAKEGIKYHVTSPRSRADTQFNQLRREYRKVSALETFRVNAPDGTPVLAPTFSHRLLFDRFAVIQVPFSLAEQKHIFMTPCWAVLDRLRLAVRLVPHDIGAQEPAIILQGER